MGGTSLLSSSLNWYPSGGAASANNGNLQWSSSVNGGGGLASSLTFSQTYSYDMVNRLTGVSDTGYAQNFQFDAFGNMYMPNGTGITPTSGTPTTVFVYDALGRMAAEYSTLQDQPNCITCYMSADQLGTARLVTDQIGNVVSRHDYTPFGGEIASNSAGRNSSQWGPFSDSINQKFTGKERDGESGLDYFGARYYGSALGRWTSPEPVPSHWTELGREVRVTVE
jgi:RHS repeat-associated protein